MKVWFLRLLERLALREAQHVLADAREGAFVPSGWRITVNRWLFPSSGYPEKAGDPRTYVRTHVELRVGWSDRLRLLVRGKATVLTTTYTDVEVQSADSKSVFWVNGL